MRLAALFITLSLIAAGPVFTQTLPKLPKLPKVRVPSRIPGGSQVNQTINKTPEQHMNDARRDEVSALMSEAITTEDPNARAQIYSRILVLDPNNQVAYQGMRDALDEASEIDRQTQVREDEIQTQTTVLMEQEKRRREALKLAEEAVLVDDVETADEQLKIVEEVAPGDLEAQRLRVIVDRKMSRKLWTMRLLIGAGVLLVIGLLAWLIIRLRRRDPYVEVVSGPHRGEKIPFDGKLFRVGAVAADGSDTNDLVLSDDDRLISRFHCEIHRRGNNYFLIDLGSANGTFIGGRRLKPGKATAIKRGMHLDAGGAATLRLGLERRKK